MASIRPHTYWSSLEGNRHVQVLSCDTSNRVMYQSVPDGRVFSTWADRFLSKFEPEAKKTFAQLRVELSAAQRTGKHVTLTPADIRVLLREIKSAHVREVVSAMRPTHTVSTSGES